MARRQRWLLRVTDRTALLKKSDASMAENNSQFDPDKQRRENAKLRALKSHNVRAVFGTGIGRIAVIVVALAMIAMIAFGLYNLLTPKAVSQRAAPQDAMLGVTGRDGDPIAANAAEAAARAQQNNAEAAQAAAQGKPYMAAPVLVASAVQAQPVGADAMAPASQAAGATPDTAGQASGDPQQNGGRHAQNGRGGASDNQYPSRYGYREVSVAIGASEVTPQILAIARGQDPTQPRRQAAYQIAYYPVEDSQQGGGSSRSQGVQSLVQAGLPGTGAVAAAAGASAVTPVKHAIPGLGAGDAFYCKFFFGMNSDLSRRDAMAKCFGGAADGATFIGKAEASAEGVGDPGFTVTFDKLKLPGHNVMDVNAVAVDVATMEENVADDVSTHSGLKFSELALAGLMKGVGTIADQMQVNQATQTVGNVSTTTYATVKPDLFQIVGGAVGGVGNAVGDYFQKKSDALKTTIKVWPNKDIGVVLFSDVTE
jgi:intracellular multiplication protein IcmE